MVIYTVKTVVYFYILLCVANLIIGFIGKKSRIVSFLSYFIIILLMSLNTKGPDIGNYLYDYNVTQSGNGIIAENGYNYFRYFCANIINLDFFAFHLLISIVCFTLIISTVSYLKANENCVIGLYLSYLFFVDTIQIRNFVVEAIFIFAVRYLFVDKRFNTIKYLICMLVAFLFHKIALIYLILVVCKFKFKLKNPLMCLYLIISILAFCFFLVSRESLKSLITFGTNLFGLKSSYNFTETRLSFIPLVALYFAEMFALMLCKRNRGIRLNGFENKYFTCVIEMHILLAISLSLLLVNINFYRIVRNISILKYISYAIYINKLPKLSISKSVMVFFIVITTVIWFVSDYVLINDFDIIAEPIFTGNLIFNSTVNNKNYAITLKLVIIAIYSFILSVKKYINFKLKLQRSDKVHVGN